MQPLDSSELIQARDRLLSGEVVAIPTETVYGLAASIHSEEGLRKIFSLKERPFFDPLIVHVASLTEAVECAANWPPLVDYLARQFWPGPFTIVVAKATHINPLITSGLDTVAIRYPSHPVALQLLEMIEGPIAAPSANKFGRTSPSKAEHVRAEFPNSGLLVIDGGECEIGLESTVVSVVKNASGDDEVRILRPGAITEEMINEALKKWWPRPAVVRASSSESPGHLQHHYMPSIPLVIVPAMNGAQLDTAILSRISSELSLQPKKPQELKLSQDAVQAARELYSEMRRLSEDGADLLFIQATSDRQGGIWTAIWDRLSRAATRDLSR
jgi:L-threonylcarbamoyladenylate synthase